MREEYWNDNFTLFRIANDEFYQWENELFPNNTTPYSDDDRILWCEGFVKAKLQNTQNGVIGKMTIKTIDNLEPGVEKIKKKSRCEATGKDHSPNSRTTRYQNLRKKIKSARKTQKRTDRFYIGKNK